MRKMLNCFLGSVMLIGLLFPTTVSAAENGRSVCTNNLAEYTKEESSSEVQEDHEKIIFLDMLQEEGDVQVLGIRDGEVYCVEVVDVTELSDARADFKDGVKSKTFLYTKTNALGVKRNLLSVTTKVTWIKNKKITSFDCSHIIYDASIGVAWEPEYAAQTDLLWMRGLDVSWSVGDYEVIYFGCTLLTVDGKDTVQLTSSTGLERN